MKYDIIYIINLQEEILLNYFTESSIIFELGLFNFYKGYISHFLNPKMTCKK